MVFPPECDREASIIRRPWRTGGCCAMEKKAYALASAVARTIMALVLGPKMNCVIYL